MDIKNKRKKEFETKVKDFMKKTNDDMYKRRQNFYILQDMFNESRQVLHDVYYRRRVRRADILDWFITYVKYFYRKPIEAFKVAFFTNGFLKYHIERYWRLKTNLKILTDDYEEVENDLEELESTANKYNLDIY